MTCFLLKIAKAHKNETYSDWPHWSWWPARVEYSPLPPSHGEVFSPPSESRSQTLLDSVKQHALCINNSSNKTIWAKPKFGKFSVTILKRQGMSLRNTPDSRASTWPPTYVSESRTWPSSVSLLNTCSCLFGKTMLPWNAWTISRASHRVPEPLRKTCFTNTKSKTRALYFLSCCFISLVMTNVGYRVYTDLIRLHRNNGAKGKNEGVNIFHVKVVCGHSVRHWVGGQSLQRKTKIKIYQRHKHLSFVISHVVQVKRSV